MESPLPPGWQEAYDPTHHRKYYYNPVSNATQWERPELSAPVLVRWFCETDDAWRVFNAKDSALIESEYAQHGPSGAFTTRFSFSSVPYRVDFASMVQINAETNTRRRIRRDVSGAAAEAGAQIEHGQLGGPSLKETAEDQELAAALAQIAALEKLADVIHPSIHPYT